MNDQPTVKPVILIQDKTMSSRSIYELRKAGYIVVQSKDTQNVKSFHPTNEIDAITKAKLALADWLLSGKNGHMTYANICEWYVDLLKLKKS